MALQSYITKKGPGIILKGDSSAIRIYDEISDRLGAFYDRKGLLFVPSKRSFVPCTTQYTHNVFKDSGDVRFEYEKDEYDNIIGTHTIQTRPPGRHAYLNLTYLGKETGKARFVEGWDFPHTPSKNVTENFLLYFNLRDLNQLERDRKSAQERNDFKTFLDTFFPS